MGHHGHGNQGGVRGAFQRFVHSEVSGSIVLLACTVVALVWANSPWASSYFDLAHKYIGVSWGSSTFALSLQHWVNDGLMVVFFFVVGLEIKRELVAGQLSSVRNAVVPVGAALGGMIVPALFYVVAAGGGEAGRGWGVPMATDIAFALGILAMFGKRVPISLKIFLTALAIADDLGAILVIAIFYTEQIHVSALIVAAVFLLLILGAVRMGVRREGVYALLIVCFWLAVFTSGVHATVAGVLVAFVVPVRGRMRPETFLERADESIDSLRGAGVTRDSLLSDPEQFESLAKVRDAADDLLPPGLAMEQHLHPVTSFLILPLFALFNAGVPIDSGFLDTLAHPVAIGIILGLVAGKQLGVLLFSWLAVRIGKSAIPEGVTWGQLYGAGCLAGVGFTMSLFVSELAFPGSELVDNAKLAVLIASLISGVWGFLVLSRTLPKAPSSS